MKTSAEPDTADAVDQPGPGIVRWRVVRDEGPASDFHQRDPGPDPGHQLWIRTIPSPALVLGSTQPDELVRADKAAEAGIEVCRRRSGGGLVYIDPATDCWLDAIVPQGSPLWRDDVGQAFHWLGRRWAAVLRQALDEDGQSIETAPIEVHRPTPADRPAARPVWCFDGIGHGEVTIGGAKVVGLSQRRTRRWARLQSLVIGAWPGQALADLIDLDVAQGLVSPAVGRPGSAVGRPSSPQADPTTVNAGPPDNLSVPPPGELSRIFLEQLRAPPAEPSGAGPSRSFPARSADGTDIN